jgi:class 3 adenylate cyclase
MEPAGTRWLELQSGEQAPVGGTCSIGRAHSNQMVLPDDKVSRHHALIRVAETGECWLVDLASVNGTYVNARRIQHAVLLRDGDEIGIGPYRLLFRSTDTASARGGGAAGELDQTAHEVRELTAWLFLVDVIDSTGISRQLGPGRMAGVFSDWVARCRKVLEESGGIIDKPLGDGFFAFWPAAERTPEEMGDALLAFKALQGTCSLPFRMVLHRGGAFTGGEMASGIYRLFGPEVSFTFRMEGLAKTLKIPCLLSEPAKSALGRHVATSDAGAHSVPGLDEAFSFFCL